MVCDGLKIGMDDDLARVRLKRVNPMLEEAIEDHREDSQDFRDLIHGREFLKDRKQIRKVRYCSDDRQVLYQILGYSPGAYDAVTTTGYMIDAAFVPEFKSSLKKASANDKELVWIDLIHPDDCVAINRDASFGRQKQDWQASIVAKNFPEAIYVSGEVVTKTCELILRGFNPEGEEIFLSASMVKASIPAKYKNLINHQEHYAIKALMETRAFPARIVYLLAKMFVGNLEYLTLNREMSHEHTAIRGSTGLGLSWKKGLHFPVTASLDNMPLFLDAERSMGIGIGIADQNVADDDPILWFVCQTYLGDDEKKQAERKALEMMKRIYSFKSLQNCFEYNRVVLVPAILEKEYSFLIPLKYS